MSKEFVSIHNLKINSFDTSSGVFVGKNQAHYWNTTSKTNQGFGQVNHSKTFNVLNAVFDNDHIDMFTNNHNEMDSEIIPRDKGEDTYYNPNHYIHLDNIHANALQSNSTISVGENKQDLWQTTMKNNYGNGKYSGINNLKNLVNQIYDNDTLDMMTNKPNEHIVSNESRTNNETRQETTPVEETAKRNEDIEHLQNKDKN